MPNSITQKVANLVSSGKTEQAIRVCLKYARKRKRKLHKHFVILSGQYQTYKSDLDIGLNPPREILVRINLSVLSISEKFDPEPNPIFSPKEKGVIVNLERKKGYGFIKANSSDYRENIFFHYSSLKNNMKPRKGQEVSFHTKHYRGNIVADKVQINQNVLINITDTSKDALGFLKSCFVELYKFIGIYFPKK